VVRNTPAPAEPDRRRPVAAPGIALGRLNFHRSTVAAAVLVTAVAAALYLPSISDPNTYLVSDELFAALTAHSIATTGQDLRGNVLPLLFRMGPPFVKAFWFAPIPIYAEAAILKVLPPSEAAAQLPTAIFAIIELVLVYVAGRQLLRKEWPALGAAALVALAPAHYMYGRMAFTYLAHLPFVMGWLVCLLAYLNGSRRVWLFVGGLILGIGIHTYSAAYVLLPIYAVLGCGVICARPHRTRGVLTFAAGFAAPALLGAIVLLWRTTGAWDLIRHYQFSEGAFETSLDPSSSGTVLSRLVEHARVYASFMTPRFWFVGPQTHTQVTRPLLFAVSGLLMAAAVRAVTRPTAAILLLTGGFVCAALPASLVPQPDAIHRVLAIVPFGALLAMMGLDQVFTAETARARAIAFIAIWTTIIIVALAYPMEVHGRQAIVRAATVPLAVAGLAVLLTHVSADESGFSRRFAVGLAVLLVLQVVYRYVPESLVLNTAVLLLVVTALLPLWPGASERLRGRPALVVAMLAVIVGLFLHLYVEVTTTPSIAAIRPSIAVPMLRLLAAAATLMVLAALVRSRSLDRLGYSRAIIAAIVVMATQIAYYTIDASPHFSIRWLQASSVLLGSVIAARLVSGTGGDGFALGRLAAVAIVPLVALQFGRVYTTGYRSPLPERAAFENALSRVQGRAVPAVYIRGRTLPLMYWRFYASKHRRPDLLGEKIVRQPFPLSRLPELPPGSLAVVNRTPQADASIAEMMAGGLVTGEALTAFDGTPSFWVLERSER
jgi:4-amino-4-deoxy-L-arabinose transferase-like glycosyltransferase